VCSGRDGCLIRMRHVLLSGGCRPWDGGQPSGRGADSDGSGDMARPLGPDGNCFFVHRLMRPLYVGWAYRGAVAMPGTIVQLAYPLPCGQAHGAEHGAGGDSSGAIVRYDLNVCFVSSAAPPGAVRYQLPSLLPDCQSVGLVYQPSFALEIPHFLRHHFTPYLCLCQVRFCAMSR